MRKIALFCLGLVGILGLQHPLFAQSYLYATGSPTYSTQIPINNGFIDVNNGEVHLELPLATQSQRGGLNLDEKLVYDSRIWQILDNGGSYSWQPTNVPNSMGGWRFESGLPDNEPAYTWYDTEYGSCGEGQEQYPTQEVFWNFTWRDPEGTTHAFDAALYQQLPLPCDSSVSPSSSSGWALDGSGYYMTLAYDTNTKSVDMNIYDKAGNQVYPTVQDTSGNYFSSDSNGNLVDTLGRTPVETSTSGNNIYYDVLTSGGARSRYTVTTETVYYNTGFGQSAVSEAQGSFTAIQSIQLPDGSSYSFTYDSGTGAGHYGELTSMTLPTGGTIQFTYQNFLDSFQNQNRWLHTMVKDGGTTTIVPATISNCTSSSGCQEKDTVTSPAGNDTVYTFTLDPGGYLNAGSWNTGTDIYQGSSTSGTKLKSVNTSYTYNTITVPASGTTRTYSVPETIDEVTTLPDVGLSSQTKTALDFIGANPTTVQQWDYYSGSAPSAPTEQTNYTYESAGSSIPTQIQETDGSGNLIAETNYEYGQTTPSPTSGLPNHLSGGGDGDNPTTVSQWINSSGSTYTTTMTYDDAGTLLTSTDPNGTTTYGHDSTDTFVTSVTPPTPSSGVSLPTTATYDASTGLITSKTGPNGNTVYYKNYDAFGRVGEIDYPDGGKTTFSYTPTQTSEHQYENASTYADTETLYDSYGRVSRIAYGDGLESSTPYYQHDTCYDSSGRVQFQSYAYEGAGWGTPKVCSGTGDQYSYDALSRVTQIEHGDGTSITDTYRGRAMETTDENGHQRIVQNDAFGKITAVCEITSDSSMPGSGSPASCGLDVGGTGFLTSYAYNLPNHETTITQGVQTRTFQTDWLGRPTLVDEPESGQTNYSYSYNSTGLVVVRTRPEANQTNSSVTTTTTTQYDALGRVVSISYSDGTPTKTYAYDASSEWGNTLQNPKGRLVEEWSAANDGAIYSYDSMGRVIWLGQCTPSKCGHGGFDIDYTYDWLGDMLSAGDGVAATTTYQYSSAGQVNEITSSLSDSTHPGTLLSNVNYGAFGPTGWQLGNGLTAVKIYDTLGRADGGWLCNGSSQSYCTGGTQLYGYTVSWRGDQSLWKCDTALGQCVNFGYDEFDRLTSQTVSSGTSQNFSYIYDRWGNRWQQNVTAGSGPSPSLSFNTANNQITTSGYTYDAAGNMTSDGIHAYTYDANGNVVEVDGGNTATYTYDALNQRVRVDTPGSDSIEYVYNINGQRVSIWDANTQSQVQGQAYWGSMPIEFYAGGTAHFETQDWEGTERLQTSYNGSVEGTYTSLSYGDGYSASGTDDDAYHFAGLDQDNSANEHAQYREYSNMAGRWMSPDPYSGSYDFSNPQSLNRYSYVMNNPLALTDPTGLQCTPILGHTMYCTTSEGPGVDGAGFLDFIEGIGEGIAEIFGAFGPPQFHGSLRPRPTAPSNVREAQQITQTCINEFNNTRIGKAANFMSMASPFIGPDRLGSTIEDVGGSTAKYGVYKYFQIASQTMPRTPFGSMSGFLSETIEMAAKDIVFPVAVAATGTQILMQGGCFASALNATGQANIPTYVAP